MPPFTEFKVGVYLHKTH